MYQKITLLFVALVMSVSAYAGFEGPGAPAAVTTVVSINDLNDDDTVTLEGNLLRKIQKERYLFKDKTGEIEVEIDDKKLRDIKVTPETPIRITGEVDKDWFSISVEADSVEIID